MRLRDPLTRIDRLFVPGGQIEPGETAAAAAYRETLEETGYQVEIAQDSQLTIRHDYIWNGVPLDVTTHFFRGALRHDGTAETRAGEPAYNEGVHWLALEEVDRELAFCEPIHQAVSRLLGVY